MSSPAPHRSLPSWITPDALVLAKFFKFPHWPAYVAYKKGTAWWSKKKGGCALEKEVWVIFLNAYTGAWVPRAHILASNARSLVAQCAVDLSALDSKKLRELEGAFEEAEDRREEGPFPVDKEEFKGEIVVEGSVVLAKYEAFPACTAASWANWISKMGSQVAGGTLLR